MVYVGNLEFGYGRMKMSHMVADTEKELHEMAAMIGIARKWFQNKKEDGIDHYDICKSKKQLAIKLGAVLMPDREIVVKFKLAEKLGLRK
jgi:hypothetical protein